MADEWVAGQADHQLMENNQVGQLNNQVEHKFKFKNNQVECTLHKFKIVSSIRSSYQGKPALAFFINFWSSSLPIQKR